MTAYDPELLDKLAELAIRVGVNLQPGQRLALGGPVFGQMGVPVSLAPLARALAKHAYRAGAPYVDVQWEDPELDRIRLQHGPPAALEEFPGWRVRAALEHFQAGDAFLLVFVQDPDVMAGQDPAAVEKLHALAAAKTAPVLAEISAGSSTWSAISGATAGWARKVFPNASPDAAERQLWDAIFDVCRVKVSDPVAAWEQHVAGLQMRADYLDNKAYQALHYRAPGTDLRVGLPSGHIWHSGRLTSQTGIAAVANIPTEEVFTLPHREQIEGVVTATKPLSYGGSLVEDFTLAFEAGRVKRATAGKGESALNAILNTDGARSLGEVALVPHSSPISQSGLLFYNILFDENASCHLALGNAYKFTLQGGTEMTDEAFVAAGGNQSATHVDFMMGSGALDVDGLKADGAAEPLLRGGEWAFDL